VRIITVGAPDFERGLIAGAGERIGADDVEPIPGSYAAPCARLSRLGRRVLPGAGLGAESVDPDGTSQSALARAEAGRTMPSIDTAEKGRRGSAR